MSKTITQFGKLIFSRAKTAERTINFSPIEPAPDLEKKLGKLVILAGYPNAPECQNFIEATIDFLRSNYYQPSAGLLLDPNQLEEHFEGLLQKTNQWLQTELRDKNLLKSFSDIDLVIILLCQTGLYFSQIGKIVSCLIQGEKTTNLYGETPPEKSSQFFSNIVSGNLEINDSLIFCFKNLLDFFSIEKIKRIVNQFPPTEATGHLNKILVESGTQINTGLIIFKTLMEEDLVTEPAPELLPTEPLPIKPSISPTKQIGVVSQEKKSSPLPAEPTKDTGTILKTDVKLKISKTFKDDLLKIKNVLNQIQNKIKNVSCFSLIKKIGVFLGYLARQFWFLLKRLIEFSKLNLLIKIIWLKIKQIISGPFKRFNRLSYLNRTILIICLILGLLFLQSLIIVGRKEIKARQERQYFQTMEEINKGKNALSTALIYGDHKKAKSLLKEIDLLFNRLPPKLANTREEVKLLREQIKQEQDRLYNLVPIEEPSLLADFSALGQKIQLKSLIKASASLYTFNPSNNYVYEYSLTTKKSSLINQTSVNIGLLKKMTYYDTDFLLGYGDQNVAFFNLIDKNFAPLEIKLEYKNPQITDLAVYQGRIYILDQSANQIYKYNKTISGFGQEQTWLEEKNLNLKNGVSLTIDASIYLLKENGDVMKFYKGAKQDFNLAEIQPRLVKPNKIFTNSESKYLYLLDPGSRRLIIFDKNGQLKKQLFSGTFDNLIDFVINEKEDVAWVLNGTKIFEIKLK